MAYFTPDQLANSNIPGLTQFNPSPGLGFSVGDIFGAVGPAVSKIFGGNTQPTTDPQMAALVAQQASAQQTQTYILVGLGAVGVAILALVASRGRTVNPFKAHRVRAKIQARRAEKKAAFLEGEEG